MCNVKNLENLLMQINGYSASMNRFSNNSKQNKKEPSFKAVDVCGKKIVDELKKSNSKLMKIKKSGNKGTKLNRKFIEVKKIPKPKYNKTTNRLGKLTAVFLCPYELNKLSLRKFQVSHSLRINSP